MKVIVCGGRNYSNFHHVRRTLSRLRPHEIIVGSERGADGLAIVWSKLFGIPYRVYEADWKNFGRAAGPIRNSQMLAAERPDKVIAFPGGDGTADMVAKARKAGVEVIEIPEEVNE
jgi:hypothetical protein